MSVCACMHGSVYMHVCVCVCVCDFKGYFPNKTKEWCLSAMPVATILQNAFILNPNLL